MRRTFPSLTVLAAMLATALAASGCGGGASGSTINSGAPAKPGVSVGIMDCSASFRRFASGYLDDFQAFATNAAAQHRIVSYGCVGGRALDERSLPSDDFSDHGPIARAANGNGKVRERLGLAAAIGEVAQMRKLLRESHYGGSDQLGALERASRNAHLDEVVMWTDLIVNDGTVNLSRTSTYADIRRIAAIWHPRLRKRLQGATVLVIGAGSGAASDAVARRALQFMEMVVHAAGGKFGSGDSLEEARSNAS